MRREHRQLRRDVEMKDAWVGALERARGDAEAQMLQVTAELVRVEADGAAAQRALAVQHAALERRRVSEEQLRRRLQESATELDVLRRRADTLAAIEAGGWWRLRGRLLRLGLVLRRITHRARTSRTG